MPEQRIYKRRHMFIEPQEQIVFMVRAWVYCLIFLGAAALPLYRPAEGWRLSDAQRVTNQFLYYHSGNLPWMIAPFVLVGLVSVIGSHRVFGPVLGFKNALRNVLDRNLSTRLSPRTGDHFGELAALINDVIESERATCKTLKDLAQAAKADLDAGRTGQAKKRIEEIVDDLGRFRLE